MATTIPASFEQFATNLEITSLQSATASTRQQEVRAAMADGFTVLDSFVTGSYMKSTMIAPLAEADIDIFIVLDSSYFHRFTPSGLLGEVRRVLRGRYPLTPEISPDGQAVTITFSDFTVDVVPAFHRQGGGFLIADTSSGHWIPTDPTTHVAQLSRENARHNGLLVPLIKMLKAWNRQSGSPLRGFYLELMTTSLLAGVTLTDYASGVRHVLDLGREAVRFAVADPAGFGDQVRGLRRGSVEHAVVLFQDAFAIAKSAEGWAQHVFYVRSAVDEWRRLFGSQFPAYG